MRNLKKENISDAVIRRLPRYYRQLTELCSRGIVRISSHSLGQEMNITASQIRQDLFCFGGFGQQGYGYKVDSLKGEIGEILGINQGHTIVVLGTVVSFTLFMRGLQDVGAVKSSMLASTEPVSATVFSALWLGTTFSAPDLIGFACIIATIFLLAKSE